MTTVSSLMEHPASILTIYRGRETVVAFRLLEPELRAQATGFARELPCDGLCPFHLPRAQKSGTALAPRDETRAELTDSCDAVLACFMKMRQTDSENSSTAAMVAPEDLRRGDYIAVLSEIVELPSFLWSETLPGGRGELVRLRRLPTEDRAPLKVKAICLPFIFVKLPSGQFETIDVRLVNLVRLERGYARTAWKNLRVPLNRASPASL